MTIVQSNSNKNIKDITVPEALNGFAFVYEQPVDWGDMDAFSHVNNVVYYDYAQAARIKYLENLGVFNSGDNIVLAQSGCRYLLPVTYPDTLLIGVRTQKIGNSSMVTEYCYYSQEQKEIVATVETVLVRLNQAGDAKQNWSDKERQAFVEFDQSAGHTPEA